MRPEAGVRPRLAAGVRPVSQAGVKAGVKAGVRPVRPASVFTIDTNSLFSFFMQQLGNRNGMGSLFKPSAFAGPTADRTADRAPAFSPSGG